MTVIFSNNLPFVSGMSKVNNKNITDKNNKWLYSNIKFSSKANEMDFFCGKSLQNETSGMK